MQWTQRGSPGEKVPVSGIHRCTIYGKEIPGNIDMLPSFPGIIISTFLTVSLTGNLLSERTFRIAILISDKEISMSGKVTLPHTCPKCRLTTAHTSTELLLFFGFRTIPSGSTNQSWCRKCRANG
ncbi:hypothetical protein ACOQH0_23400 (plasmid) [Enterobacter sp. JS8-1]|uniref:hypothetical protein n=1 Tax=Enterobacter sp. JS8-1 TaxID=3411633 RepID=UPI003BA12C96